MEDLVRELLKTNQEFKRAYRDHQKYEEQLERMNAIRRMTSRDEMERKNIQKLKLKRKDDMERILLTASKDKAKA